MNEHDLLFNEADLDLWKRRKLPDIWLDDRMDLLRARLQSQSRMLDDLLAGASPALAMSLSRDFRT